jgi:hypothetical protein
MALDLEAVIEDSLTDAVIEPEVDAPIEHTSIQTGDEADPATPAESEVTEDKTVIDTPSKSEQEEAEAETAAVASPASKAKEDEVEDEFAKQHGLPPQMPGGRENRIPYSRVKRIAANHAKTEVEKAKKAWEAESSPFKSRVAELEPKVQDYEQRLIKVGQFEQVMVNDPRSHLEMLSQLPAYKDFFDFVNQAATAARTPQQQQPAQAEAAPQADEPMPQPDFKLEDGTMVYSMDGLQKLQDWQTRQVEARVGKTYEQKLNERLAEVDKQYAPLKQRYEAEQYMAQVVPQIQKQIETARQWPLFNENEDEITKALQADNSLSLEGAYRQVVIPKLQANRDQMRTSLLAEIQKKPASTAVTRSAATKPNTQPASPTGDLTDIITQQVKNAGLM